MIIPKAERIKDVEEYYFSKKLHQIAEINRTGADVINLGIGSPDLPPPLHVIESLYQSALDPLHHGYQGYKGTPEFRAAIAQFYQSIYKVTLHTEEVLPLLGSKEGVSYVSWAFLNQKDIALVPELGYPAYKAAAKLCQANAIAYSLTEKNWQPDWNILENILKTEKNIKLLWLNYPHMPTGAPASYETFERVIALAHQHKFLVCHDNPYSLVLPQRSPISILSVPKAKEVAIELNSMSKSHNMAGWRIGWVAGNPQYLTAILQVKSNVDSGMFRAVQDAAIEALALPIEWHHERNKEYSIRKELVIQLLQKLGCSYQEPQEGMFVWAKLPPHASDAEKFADSILEKYHIFITPGTVFGEKGRKYVRISLCSPQQRIIQAINRIN
ncbi:MAG: aminotransferase class I/II-fold pyridoxal phosphate-dependent enzyme [Cytophagales bacterium]|nr:aminotransferase class I/II-fold pyridoxal phosphate-dependent enzyme [Cytophagales bacterium]MDW8384696.1 aminotransferase class I/II-fold pyridoxal phosphate-dependent enzyme [Flammeovirgaceae bacterium]